MTSHNVLDGRVKVAFPLSEAHQNLGLRVENMWAKPIGGNLYRVDNVPFHAYGISWNDVVRADEVEGRLCFNEVARRGGHSTFRVLLQLHCTSGDCHREFREGVARRGCSFESGGPRLYAVDVPPAADIEGVYRFLEEGERQGNWSFEEGHNDRKTPAHPAAGLPSGG